MAPPEDELLAHLDRRDMNAAATCLVRRHADEVLSLCRAMVRDDVMAEDLSQDVFGRAFSALATFRGDATSRTWILRIARNRCIDYLRSVQRQPWGLEEDVNVEEETANEPSVDDLLSRHRDVRVGLDALDEGERAMVMLRFGHGLGYGELADAFGLREGAVRMRVSRAIGKMREALSPPVRLGAAAPGAPPAASPASISRGAAIPQGGPPGAPSGSMGGAPPIPSAPSRARRAQPPSSPTAPSPAAPSPAASSPAASPPAASSPAAPSPAAPSAGAAPTSAFASTASATLRARLTEMARLLADR